MRPGFIEPPVAAVRTRLRRSSLDRRLAAGANPDECDDLSRRADQLRSSVHRRELAAALLTLVEKAEGPTPPISAAVALDRRSILACRSDLIALALDLPDRCATEFKPASRLRESAYRSRKAGYRFADEQDRESEAGRAH